VQLELSSTTTSYTYVQRGGITAVVLPPSSNKCCCLSSGDTIKFSATNISVMVILNSDVQVDSSLPMEIDETMLPVDATATTSFQPVAQSLNAVGTPNMSASEKVKETPVHHDPLPDDLPHTVPQPSENSPNPHRLESTASGEDKPEPFAREKASEDATESESEGEDTAKSYLSKLDFQSRRPSVTTTVQKSRKRLLDLEDFSATPIAKKARKEDTEDDEPEVSAIIFCILRMKRVY
jgi:hypothetical protein